MEYKQMAGFAKLLIPYIVSIAAGVITVYGVMHLSLELQYNLIRP